jgi:hypothetical protein
VHRTVPPPLGEEIDETAEGPLAIKPRARYLAEREVRQIFGMHRNSVIP